MDVKELRVGNLIDRNGIMEVLGIGANNRLVIFDHYNNEKLPYGLDVDTFEGIPLSPEWLERFGFEKADHKEYRDLSTGWFSIAERDGYFKLATPSELIGKQFKFVHQLQNLYFALTGSELDLTPVSKE